MAGIFETTNEDIKRLNAFQLTDLLRRLLLLEAKEHGIPRSCVHGSLQITAADGGEDASIEWKGEPTSTEWLPNRNTMFQCKATTTEPTACEREVLVSDRSAVKPRIDKFLSAGGAYILFCTTSCNSQMSDDRVNAIRNALRAQSKTYADKADIRVYDANKISTWTNTFISAIVFVRTALGAHIPASFQTWTQWAGYFEFQQPFIADAILDEHIFNLRSLFHNHRAVARILGLSGVGKTRVALEAFRPPADSVREPEQQAMSDNCVYIDADRSSQIPEVVREWVRDRLQGSLIVDNCDTALHKALQREVQHAESGLSLLTLDYTMEVHPSDQLYIELTRVSDEVTKGIIRNAYPNFSVTDVSRIVAFAQGFPRMAVLIANAQLDSMPDIVNLRDQDLVDRLLWQRGQPDLKAKKVIQACSLFHHLGYEGDVAEQRIFVAERICHIDKDDFYRYAQKFIDHRIIDRRNRFIRVVPFPLAITLAAQWWQGCSPELAKELFLSQMPDGMAETLCDQLAKLDFVPRACEIVADLCGENGPFGQVEVLLSEHGSRLFRSIVEVNPEPCLKALERAIGDWPRERLLNIGPARRNFVWSLEKLSFWAETFPSAARLMLALAAAENESWGNNATHQFLQLYHLYLSGTQAAPSAKIEIIDEALASDCPARRTLAVRALGSALEMNYFTRSGGVELQGSRPPARDWEPKVRADVFDYQDECIERLSRIACGSNTELATLAKKELGQSLRGLIMRCREATLEEAIRAISVASRGFWPEALQALRHALEYEGSTMPSKIRKQVESWLTLLEPSGIEERLRLLISLPDYEHRKEKDGRYTDVAAERAVVLAQKLAPKIEHIIGYLPVLLTGEQRHASTFGKELAQRVNDRYAFASRILNTLRSMPDKNGNPSLLCGFLAGQKSREIVTRVLEEVSVDQALISYLVELTRLSRPTSADLTRIINLTKEGCIPVGQLFAFSVNSVLDHLDPDAVMAFCDDIAQLGVPGVACALNILFMYVFQKEERNRTCQPAFRRYMRTQGLISEIGQNPTRGYIWEQTAVQLLSLPETDPQLAESIARDIASTYSQEEFSNDARDYVSKALKVLLHHYFHFAWPPIGEAMLSENWYRFEYLLADDWNEMKTVPILAVSPLDELLEWCEQHHPEGARSISRCLPVVKQEDENKQITWHPFARAFFDSFGEDEKFLSGISDNLQAFSWFGSVVPYYEMQIRLMEELLPHKFRQVQKWARDYIQWLKEQINKELKRDEEHDLGVF